MCVYNIEKDIYILMRLPGDKCPGRIDSVTTGGIWKAVCPYHICIRWWNASVKGWVGT